ncbi:hypothetical protein Bca52824_059243 [Brassica carinata]|uniref:Uncharacterized protein n=1 Tax=Brassica carinata TaxID=52824 RepID=A0A8X7QW67_BRACI|nr:hypothetical protein Bca52824_059243 [Brassica carinata]
MSRRRPAAATNAQDEANDEAREAAEMEADLAAQMEDQVEVEFISSTAPQPSQPSQGNQAPNETSASHLCFSVEGNLSIRSNNVV